MNILDFIILGLATVKYMMILSSFDLPVKTLELIKKTKSDWIRLLLAKTGMFFDCPVCVSFVSAVIALTVCRFFPVVNVFLAVSVLGLIIKKRFIDR